MTEEDLAIVEIDLPAVAVGEKWRSKVACRRMNGVDSYHVPLGELKFDPAQIPQVIEAIESVDARSRLVPPRVALADTGLNAKVQLQLRVADLSITGGGGRADIFINDTNFMRVDLPMLYKALKQLDEWSVAFKEQISGFDSKAH